MTLPWERRWLDEMKPSALRMVAKSFGLYLDDTPDWPSGDYVTRILRAQEEMLQKYPFTLYDEHELAEKLVVDLRSIADSFGISPPWAGVVSKSELIKEIIKRQVEDLEKTRKIYVRSKKDAKRIERLAEKPFQFDSIDALRAHLIERP